MEIHRRMTLYRRKSNSEKNAWSGFKNEPYLIINLIFAGVIILIFVYSGIFSPEKNSYPVSCIHEKLTGEPCISCGLSHSFSLIIRGKIGEAYEWNIYGMRVFLFFASQLILRFAFSGLFMRYRDTRKELIITDCIGSVVIFFIAFWPYISSIFSGFLHS